MINVHAASSPPSLMRIHRDAPSVASGPRLRGKLSSVGNRLHIGFDVGLQFGKRYLAQQEERGIAVQRIRAHRGHRTILAWRATA